MRSVRSFCLLVACIVVFLSRHSSADTLLTFSDQAAYGPVAAYDPIPGISATSLSFTNFSVGSPVPHPKPNGIYFGPLNADHTGGSTERYIYGNNANADSTMTFSGGLVDVNSFWVNNGISGNYPPSGDDPGVTFEAIGLAPDPNDPGTMDQVWTYSYPWTNGGSSIFIEATINATVGVSEIDFENVDDVGLDDFDLSAAGSAASVPEPGGAILLLIALGGTLWRPVRARKDCSDGNVAARWQRG
jgi:hypothetical protein